MENHKLIIGKNCHIINYFTERYGNFIGLYVDVMDDDGNIIKGKYLHWCTSIDIDEHYIRQGAAVLDILTEQDGYYTTLDGRRIQRVYGYRLEMINKENYGVKL